MFFYITGRMGHFANSHARLCFMDTDSEFKKTLPPRRLKKRKQENHTVFSSGFFMSYQRRRTPLEMEEVNTLLAANQRIPFYQSLTAQRMTTHYLATFGSILDWSSIGQVRPLFSKEAFTYKTSYTLNFFF